MSAGASVQSESEGKSETLEDARNENNVEHVFEKNHNKTRHTHSYEPSIAGINTNKTMTTTTTTTTTMTTNNSRCRRQYGSSVSGGSDGGGRHGGSGGYG
ncbi:hypothetical protein KIN20_021876 [Parelaphostrongylus tenuis]|uniref:Uncharacterized protein n=1 Tax=Parelaphostrongylus tenuis TaxID=148309 RepID=A0AAD5QRV4_PARTN|nr:hypothetical protein KIN20_021876 [Parelaphostrongylus tenuis]